jgi:signal transduction histidine kinase
MVARLISLAQEHDPRLVVLAGFICLLSCYTGFSLIARTGKPGSTTSDPWLVAAAIVFGCGFWAALYVALLGFQPGIPVGYETRYALLSAAVGICGTGLGFALVVRQRAALGGMVIGAALAVMNFAAMASMRLAALEQWNGSWIVLSCLIGMGFGAASLALNRRVPKWSGQLAAAFLLVIGSFAVHFTGMAALRLSANPALAFSQELIPPIWFPVAITAVTLLILGLGVIGSLVDQHIQQLETVKCELGRAADQLSAAVEGANAANEAKSQFLATMSHELRTPLNAVLGFSEMLMDPSFVAISANRVSSYATSIHASGSHLLALINDILDISKFDSGHLQLHEEEVDLRKTITACIELLSLQAEKAKIRLDATIPRALPALWADERRLRQVVLNLISNATKFTPEGGNVHVRVSAESDGVILEVRDTGIGMLAEDIPVALEPFGQIDSRLSRKYSGTGLGLPLSKRLVELHGATLAIESEVGVGTTVTIVLPKDRVLVERQVA